MIAWVTFIVEVAELGGCVVVEVEFEVEVGVKVVSDFGFKVEVGPENEAVSGADDDAGSVCVSDDSG